MMMKIWMMALLLIFRMCLRIVLREGVGFNKRKRAELEAMLRDPFMDADRTVLSPIKKKDRGAESQDSCSVTQSIDYSVRRLKL